jgi:hypothetical protein
MADTFYKYQPQAPSTNVNWAEVSKNFTDILSDEVRVRQEKKAAINEGTRELQRTLNTTEQGLHGTANQWMLKGAAEIQEVMSMQDRLLQNGSLRLSDYTVMRQNLVDGTDGMLALFKTFNTEYKERMARASDAGGAEGAQSQELEAWAMQQIEGFANFSSSAYIVNPETGTGSVGMIVDGEVSRNPNDLRSVASLNGMMGQQYDYYDLEESTQAMAADLGETSEIFRTYGGRTAKGLITKVSSNNWRGKTLTDEDLETLGMSGVEGDMLNMYTASENQFISTIMSDMYHTSSILTNNIYEAGNGENYTFTFDEDRGENEILLTIDPITGAMVPTYTEEQEEDVKNAIRTSLRSKLDSTTETSVVSDYTPPPRIEAEADAQEEIDRGLATDWSRLWYGTLQEKSAALESLFGTEGNQDLQEFNFNAEGDIVLDYADDSKDRIIKVGTATNYEDFLRTGTEITGIANGDRIIELAGAIPEGRTQVKGGATTPGASRGTDPLVPIAVAKQYTSNAIPKSVFTAGVSEDEAAVAINSAYEAYGIKAIIPVSARDKISIQKNINFGTNKEAEWVTITDWLTNYEGTDGEKKYNDAMEAINGVLSTYDTEVIEQINQRAGNSGSGELD